VLRMPIRRFWLLMNNVSRISAEQDMRALSVGVAVNSGQEGYRHYRENLVLELGSIAKVEDKLDRTGLQRLAALS